MMKRFTATLLSIAFVAALTLSQEPPKNESREPIAFIGHGAVFDADGKEINVTPQFIREAQQWYLNSLYRQAPPNVRSTFDKNRKSLFEGGILKGQSELLANSILLSSLLAQVKPQNAGELAGKLRMLEQLLRTKQLSQFNQPISLRDTRDFQPPSEVQERLKAQESLAAPHLAALATDLGGVDYINQCNSAGVPIPPDWGDAKWISKGILPDEFISAALEAEVFAYDSTSPEGACIALPRSNGDTIELLGIICLGKTASKVCFWDNQNNKTQFPIKKGTVVPLASFAGGADLDGGTGGICTDCHAGENPYVLHPKTTLGLPNLKGLKLRPDNFYEPLVSSGWPQNAGPSTLLDSISSVGQCTDCHAKGGSGGRFPNVSTSTPGYCGAVLRNAIARTMPPGAPGDPDYADHTNALLAACKAAP